MTIARRKLLTTIGGAAVWPLAAQAQQGERMRRIGVLMLYPENDSEGQLRAGYQIGGGFSRPPAQQCCRKRCNRAGQWRVLTESLLPADKTPVIKPKSNRKTPRHFNKERLTQSRNKFRYGSAR
jgi:hypothetical protein